MRGGRAKRSDLVAAAREEGQPLPLPSLHGGPPGGDGVPAGGQQPAEGRVLAGLTGGCGQSLPAQRMGATREPAVPRGEWGNAGARCATGVSEQAGREGGGRGRRVPDAQPPLPGRPPGWLVGCGCGSCSPPPNPPGPGPSQPRADPPLLPSALQAVVLPSRRGTAEALQITVGHVLGDAGSPYLTGLVASAIQAAHGASALWLFRSLQSAFFLCAFVLVLGGACFLLTALHVERDQPPPPASEEP
ncbi:protein spinster homolog 3 [Gracilinanus agilis]|uniref:protein spinster homolog 3 n=1 Tax=Gracilinanus agilis TaxID=191870 RepID=UPI001CFD4D22|nr:protein spinster homolog 3 [Gracilinanus agilis]